MQKERARKEEKLGLLWPSNFFIENV